MGRTDCKNGGGEKDLSFNWYFFITFSPQQRHQLCVVVEYLDYYIYDYSFEAYCMFIHSENSILTEMTESSVVNVFVNKCDATF